MEFIDYIKERESQLIKAIGEKDWKENKVYFINEIISMAEEWKAKDISIEKCNSCGSKKVELIHRCKCGVEW